MEYVIAFIKIVGILTGVYLAGYAWQLGKKKAGPIIHEIRQAKDQEVTP